VTSSLFGLFLFAGDCRKIVLELRENPSPYTEKGGNKEKTKET